MGKLQGSFHLFREGPPSPLEAPSQTILDFVGAHLGPGKVLELGGGNGAYGLGLQRAGRDVTIADINPDYLAVAQAAGLKTLLVDPNQALDAKSWDNVVMIEVLEHVPDPAQFLAQACAAARRRVIFTIPCSNDFEELFAMTLSYGHMAVTDHLNHFDHEGLDKLVKPWRDRTTIEAVDWACPVVPLMMLDKSFRSRAAAFLCLLPLRIAKRFGWLDQLYPTRYLVSIDLSV